MQTFFDHQLPPPCEDELASAFQFVNGTAYKYGIDPIDVQAIARSDSFSQAVEYVDKLKKVDFELRAFETIIIIDTCVRAYNCTSVLVAFGEVVGTTMREWEEKRRLPLMTIWCSHPSNFDSLRTFVWSQKEFRNRVEVIAHRRLTELSAVGAYLDPKPESVEFSLKPTPVEQLIDCIKLEYRDHLGIFPIPE